MVQSTLNRSPGPLIIIIQCEFLGVQVARPILFCERTSQLGGAFA